MCKAFWASQEDLWSWDFVSDSTTCIVGPWLRPCVTFGTSLSQVAPFSSLPCLAGSTTIPNPNLICFMLKLLLLKHRWVCMGFLLLLTLKAADAKVFKIMVVNAGRSLLRELRESWNCQENGAPLLVICDEGRKKSRGSFTKSEFRRQQGLS